MIFLAPLPAMSATDIAITYIIFHLPAIIMLITGLVKRKKKPVNAKTWFILSAIYFLIGGGYCGLVLS